MFSSKNRNNQNFYRINVANDNLYGKKLKTHSQEANREVWQFGLGEDSWCVSAAGVLITKKKINEGRRVEIL